MINSSRAKTSQFLWLIFLKENHWFALNYTGETNMTPQTEEGIESVFWLEESSWKSRLTECYEGLKELLQSTC